jgi:hypothetical protein
MSSLNKIDIGRSLAIALAIPLAHKRREHVHSVRLSLSLLC